MDETENGSAEVAEELAEVVETVIAAPIAAAVEAQEAAEETAEQIAAAAMETHRGHKIEQLERALEECQATLRELPSLMGEQLGSQLALVREEVARLETTVNALEGARAAPAIIAVTEASQPESIQEPLEPTAEVQPETLNPPPAESVAVVPPRKRHRFL